GGAGTGGTGGAGTGGMSGTGGTGGGSSCAAVADTGTGCTLTAHTTAVSTTPAGCVLLSRDASACAACRTALGLGGFWLNFSCRVGMSLVSSGGRQFVHLQADSQPDYQTDYFPTSDACYTPLGTKLNPTRISAKAMA